MAEERRGFNAMPAVPDVIVPPCAKRSYGLLSRVGTPVAIVLLLLGAAILLWPQFGAAGWVQDEAILLVYPQQMMHGAVPQRDFQSLYGPGNDWLLTLVYGFAHLSITVERSVGLIYRLSIVLSMFLLARRWGLVPGLLSGSIAALAFPQLGLGAYAWLGALALALWALWLLQGAASDGRRESYRWFFAGLLAGLALLFRPDMIVALALGAFVFLLARPTHDRLWFAGGAALGLAPFCIQLWVAGVRAVVRNLVIDPVFRIHSGRVLPWPSGWNLASVEFWLLFVTSVLLILLGASTWYRTRRLDAGRPYLAYGLFAAALLSQPIQRADQTHVNFVACVILALIPSLVAGAMQQFGQKPRVALITALVLSGALLWGQWSLNDAYLHPTSAPVTNEGRTFPVSDAKAAATLEWMLGNLDQQVRSGERLFVGPTDLSRTPLNDTYFYFLLPDLTPATYFLEMNPGSANAPGTRLARDLATADIVILDDVYQYWGEPNTANQPGSVEANQVLKAMFCPAGDYGAYHVLRRCSASE